jgi:hypothetical protein
LEADGVDEEGLAEISTLTHADATALWRANGRPESRAELLKKWSMQIHDTCATVTEVPEDALYRDARKAALLGQREARLSFIKAPPLDYFSMARRIDLWNDWAETAPRLLDEAVAQGDGEALLLRGIALGFDGLAVFDSEPDWTSLANALPDDPVRAYRDLRAYLARDDRDTQLSELVRSLLPQLQQRLAPAQRAAIDAEFAGH